MLGISVEFHGPIFSGAVGDKVRQTIHDTIHDLMIEGEHKIDLQLYAGHGWVTGHLARSIHGEMTGTLSGRIRSDEMGHPVIYEAWIEGVSSRNQRSRFKGYWMYRNAYRHLEQIKVDVVKKWVTRLVKDLS